jgi:hypothetical protein
MLEPKKSLIALACAPMLVAASVLLAPRGVHAQTVAVGPNKPVLVVNSPSEPVPVTLDGQIQVDVSNDTLDEPYNESRSTSPGAGVDSEDLTFDVPPGKRLVVESITLRATVPTGQRARCFFNTPEASGMLPVQSQGTVLAGLEDLFGAHPIKLRVDGDPDVGETDEVIVQIQRSSTAGTWSMHASVHGYLVPLP